MIKAPYNFVPLSEKVFYPPWAEDVSHDIPFSDGESGEIEITITAKSPIFIRDHKNPEEFCHYIDKDGNKHYYIPGTSVKGMVRNVLEIMSFSKMKISDKYAEKTSVRDLSNMEKLVGSATGKTNEPTSKFGYGILEITNENINFIDYGNKIRLILQDDLVNDNQTEYDASIKNCKDVANKYATVDPFTKIKVTPDRNNNPKRNNYFDKYVVKPDINGADGELFFGGHFGQKHYEFVLLESDRRDNLNSQVWLPDDVFENFKKIYFDNNDNENYVGNYWRNKTRIPVFYNKSGNRITDLGLTQLFKKMYKKSIYEASLQDVQKSYIKIGQKYIEDIALDLSEVIFGANRKKASSLKGRVQFSHFKADFQNIEKEEVYTVLGSPRPSYYPEYIKQNCQDGKVVNDDYKTLMDDDAQIAGWKRYPLRFGKPTYITAEEGTDSATKFFPLGKYDGNRFNEFSFRGKLRFHNLNKIELGALLSALSFHMNQNKFYHNIGMAKSLGFGKIKIDVDTDRYKEYIMAYEFAMTKWTEEKLNKRWIETEQIKELFVMAYKDLNIDENLKYLILDPENNINEFVDAKNVKINREYVGRDCLMKVSQMVDENLDNILPTSLLENEDCSSIESEYLSKKQYYETKKQKILEKVAEQQEKEKKIKKYKEEFENAKSSDNIQVKKDFVNKYSGTKDALEIEKEIQEITINKEKEKLDKHNQEAEDKLNNILNPNNKRYKKSGLQNFIKKYSDEKHNKGSDFILQLVEKAKQELK
jgi:CRISPR-associated protein (TIGR03986 family)